MKRLAVVAVCVCTFLATTMSHAASYKADLETWISRDLTPYVTQQLTSQPRFRNESIRFVVMADEKPQSASSKLALDIRDRLRDAVAKEPGLRIVWRRDVGAAFESGRIDCLRDQVNYYIGIEVVEDRGGLINVDIRALDIEERSWVAGFSRSWRGYPNTVQKRQLQQVENDGSFRGKRDSPYDESQFDLLAAHFAHVIGCAVLRQTAGEYVVTRQSNDSGDDAEVAMLELIGNNLSEFRAARFTTMAGDANSVIAGKAHLIDDELYQYWVTITPIDTNSDLSIISASAYIRIREKYASATLIPAVTVPMAKSDAGFLGGLKIVELRNARSCLSGQSVLGDSRVFNSRYSTSATDCYALAIDANRDSVLFFLNHQLNNGLVRLSGPSCSRRTEARIARSDEQLHFPLPIDSLMTDSWVAAYGWRVNPVEDTFYVVAATDTKAARALSKHIRQLPNRCSVSVRGGLKGRELRRWLDKFSSIAEQWKQNVDWQAIRVDNIYQGWHDD